jgi:glucosamine-6-phosphate deaminase
VKLEICPDKAALGEAAAAAGADINRDAVARRGEATITVATGKSQFEMLEHLVAAPRIDWSKVTAFHLDEYIGLPESHPGSFRRYLDERLRKRLPGLKAFIAIEGDARNVEVEIARLNRVLEGRRVDACFAGIGENCHLAFNDPPADFEAEAPFLLVELDEACRRQQLGEAWFRTLDDVPKHAISMSVRQIMKSEHLIVCVSEERKAEAVRHAVEGPVSNLYPASILQLHAACRVYLDPAAATLLRAAARA